MRAFKLYVVGAPRENELLNAMKKMIDTLPEYEDIREFVVLTNVGGLNTEKYNIRGRIAYLQNNVLKNDKVSEYLSIDTTPDLYQALSTLTFDNMMEYPEFQDLIDAFFHTKVFG